MTEERLFEPLVNTPAGERAVVLDRMCCGDAGLRGRLEALLAADGTHLREPPTADAPSGTGVHDPDGTHPIPESVGEAGQVVADRYKLVERIGEGDGERVGGPAGGGGEAEGGGQADQAGDGLEDGARPVRGRAAGAGPDGPPDAGTLEVSDFWAPGRLQYRATPAANQHFLTVTAFDLATGKPAEGFTPSASAGRARNSARWYTPSPPPRPASGPAVL